MMDAESLAERRIREAIERGEFNGLPGAGHPIPDLDDGDDPAWWVRRTVERERLAEAFAEARAEVAASLAGVWGLPDETAVRSAVSLLNQRLAGAAAAARRHPEMLEVDVVLADWRAMHRARP
jgi:hypothetical protein